MLHGTRLQTDHVLIQSLLMLLRLFEVVGVDTTGASVLMCEAAYLAAPLVG